MIVDIENNGDNLIISYYNKDGEIDLKYFKVKPEEWVECSLDDKKRDLNYMTWNEKPVKKIKSRRLNNWGVLEFIHNLDEKTKKELTALNFPKIQSIDIETEIIDGFPNPEFARERINTISITYENEKTIVLGWNELSKEDEKYIFDEYNKYFKDYGNWQFKYIKFNNEYEMLQVFASKIVPKLSLAIGWNFIDFDWKFISNRCKILNIDLQKASPTKKLDYKTFIPLHIGILDYMQVYKKWDKTIDTKENNTLDFVSSAVLKGLTKLKYNGTLQELYEKDFPRYVLYNAIDSTIVLLIHKTLKTVNAQLAIACYSNLTIQKAESPINLSHAMFWEGFYKRNKVIVNKDLNNLRIKYEGAYVKEPVPGIYRMLCAVDSASHYPSIARQFNISPESYIKKITDQDELNKYKEDPNYVVTVNNVLYDNTKDSVMREIYTDLYVKRKAYRDKALAIEQLLQKNKK